CDWSSDVYSSDLGYGRDWMLCSWIQLIVIALLCVILYIYTKAYMALITLIILSFLVFTSGVALLWVRRKMQVTLTSGWPAYKGETGKILLKVQNTGIFPVTYITCHSFSIIS